MSQAQAAFSPEQEDFRTYCRQWLLDNPVGPAPAGMPSGPLEITQSEHMAHLQRWQKKAWEAGLIGCDYPVEYGGQGRQHCQEIANEEMSRAGFPFLPNIVGLGMAAPTILHHASEELKRELLPPIFSGEEIWCQGFSEPGAGSDLANVQATAERKGDKWIINGHKVWTSLAHFSRWMILLARTDRSDKYKGLTYFVAPMFADGITISPLVKITGESGFNEVFFENLEIDDRYRLDEVGTGWQVAMTTLLHERGASGLRTPEVIPQDQGDGGTVDARSLIELARTAQGDGGPAAQDPIYRDRLMQLLIRERAKSAHERRAQVPALQDHPQRLALQNKLLNSELVQDSAALALDMTGSTSTLAQGDANAPDGGLWPYAYMNSFGATIAAGTSEIQRNILGERVLGLPRSK